MTRSLGLRRFAATLTIAFAASGLVATPASALNLQPPPTSSPVAVTVAQLQDAWVGMDEASAVTGLSLRPAADFADCLLPGQATWTGETVSHPQCFRMWQVPEPYAAIPDPTMQFVYNLMIVVPTEDDARSYIASWQNYAATEADKTRVYTNTADRLSYTYSWFTDFSMPESLVFTHVGNVIVVARCAGYKVVDESRACAEAIADRQVAKGATLAAATTASPGTPTAAPPSAPSQPSAACVAARKKLAAARKDGTKREIRIAKRRVAAAC